MDVKHNLISLKESNILIFKKEFNKLEYGDIFIDSMDPNDINIQFDKELHKKAQLFRDYALENSNGINYIYFSTCNLYKPSFSRIDESSEIRSTFSPYLKMKFNSEKLVKKNCESNFTILRLVNIWEDHVSNSFFGDLINAKLNNLYMNPIENDNLVISYANIFDICKIIKFIITNKKTGIINISTNSFNSRENLKSIINKTDIIPISRNLGYRIYSSIIDWRDILDKKTELF